MDANVEQLSRVEFSIKENSDNFAAIHMVASSDGENYEKVVSVNKADLDNLTINYKFENLKFELDLLLKAQHLRQELH